MEVVIPAIPVPREVEIPRPIGSGMICTAIWAWTLESGDVERVT
jgi:hypothetical protein